MLKTAAIIGSKNVEANIPYLSGEDLIVVNARHDEVRKNLLNVIPTITEGGKSMITDTDSFRIEIAMGIPEDLPPKRALDPSVDHAPSRPLSADPASFKLAIENALRYFPEEWHSELSMEFAEELDTFGHIHA